MGPCFISTEGKLLMAWAEGVITTASMGPCFISTEGDTRPSNIRY